MRPTTFGREPTAELSGPWTFATDPDDVGVREAWNAPGPVWPGSQEIAIPHSWQELEALREYTGTAWYRRTFDAKELDDDEQAFLRFGAVDYEASVWVNGHHLGDHRGGYLPFELHVTDALQGGENTVVLRVHDPADCAEIPHGKQGGHWYTRVSGPWQRIDLVVVSQLRVGNIRATPDLDEDAVRLDIDVTGETALPKTLHASINITKERKLVATTRCPIAEDGTGTVIVSLDEPHYWTPDTPHLYEIEVSLRDEAQTVDRYVDSFGMRSIAVEDGSLFLNGEPVRIRGALDQGYYPETHYRPADLETYRTEIELAKELGFNLLRKHIKPPHPRFLELADRLGILVWAEPANPDVYTGASKAAVRDQLLGMIDRDYNRPSVVIWSLYNEEWGIGGADGEESLWTDTDKQVYLTELYQTVRERDPTRLICDNSGWAHVATDLNDYHEYFVSPDRAWAWDERLEGLLADPGENYATRSTDPADAAIVISEFGTWGFPSLERLREGYGGDPPWFDREELVGIREPVELHDRFEASPFSAFFNGLEDLAVAWQRREFDAIAYQIETMRERGAVAGYVLTEFTDIEWEFNGILDYTRRKKAFHEDFRAVNAPVTCWLDPHAHAVYGGKPITADIVVSNDTPRAVSVTVEWTAGEAFGSLPVDLGRFTTRRLDEPISVDAPDVDEITSIELAVRLPSEDISRRRTVPVIPRTTTSTVAIYTDHTFLGQILRERGYTVVDDLTDAGIWITTDPVDDALAFAADGGVVLVLPDRDAQRVDTATFTDRTLPERASWTHCASFVAQTLLPELDPVPGWAFAGLYPSAVVTDIQPTDEISIAYTEGWIANVGAVVLERTHGDGEVAVCTLQLLDAYGDHPIATVVLDTLIDAHG